MNRTARRWFVLGILFVLGIGLVGSHWRHEQNLLSRSTFVMSLQRTGQESYQVVDWLSNEEVFCIVPHSGRSDEHVIINPTTGAKRSLSALDAYLRKLPASMSGFSVRCFSPDRQWLLASTYDEKTRKNTIIVVRLDGTQQVEFVSDKPYFYWAANSQEVYGFDERKQALSAWSLSQPPKERSFSLPAGAKDLRIFASLPQGLLTEHRQLTNNPLDAVVSTQTLDLSLLQIREDRLIETQRTVIPLPWQGRDGGKGIAPEGNRIALNVFHDEQQGLWPRWLRRLLRQQQEEAVPSDSIWVCGIDGKGMREIGRVQYPPQRATFGPFLGYFGWMPDGKHLWYTYDNRLWRVLVPD